MPTSALMHKSKKIFNNPNEKGFTLLEVMVVLAIIIGIVGLAITNLQPPSRSVRADIRNILVIGKRLSQQAQLDGKMYRIAFDLNDEQGSYWVESANRKTAGTASPSATPFGGSDSDEADPRDFTPDTRILKKKAPLPKGFRFLKIILIDQDLAFEEGIGYVHFFPQGLADSAIIQIANQDESFSWTLVTNPLSGNIQLIDGLFSEKDLIRK
ncbi:MAG: type II secretion system protein [Bdellovibrionales bacterium]|nr:type II secretion system protein [Bdellovibrionales bacterium]